MGAAAPARKAPARRRVTAPLPARTPPPGRRAPARKPPAARRSVPRSVPRGAVVLDKLLYGRGWIGLMFVLLAGIVFFNVDLLQMNREIAQNADRAAGVKRENARLRTDLARLGSSERIQEVAARAGLVLPAPGEVRYLRSTPALDAKRAAERIKRGEVSGPEVAAPVPPPQQTAPKLPTPEATDPATQAPAQPQTQTAPAEPQAPVAAPAPVQTPPVTPTGQ